jgi:hypothetical protein
MTELPWLKITITVEEEMKRTWHHSQVFINPLILCSSGNIPSKISTVPKGIYIQVREGYYVTYVQIFVVRHICNRELIITMTPRSRVLLEDPIATRLLKIFPHLSWNPKFMAMSTGARHLTLSSAR